MWLFLSQQEIYMKNFNPFKPKKLVLPILSMIITKKCNYNCWYCYDKEFRENKDLDINLIKKYIDTLQENIDIQLIGGEPTLHPQFKEIMNILYINKHINSIDIISNGSNSFLYFQDLFLKYKNKLHISFSYHHDVCDYEIFKQKMKNLFIYKYNFHISYMIEDIDINIIQKHFLELPNCRILPIRGLLYNEKIQKFIKEYFLTNFLILKNNDTQTFILQNKFIENQINPFFGYSCKLKNKLKIMDIDGVIREMCNFKIINLNLTDICDSKYCCFLNHQK